MSLTGAFFLHAELRKTYMVPMNVYLEGVGEVAVVRSERAGRVSISVRPGSVRVAVPRGVPLEEGRAFALSRSGWIRRHVERMSLREAAHRELLRRLPPIGDEGAAKEKIILRLRQLSLQTGLRFRHVTVRSQKTRWGSLSAAGDISLNIALARLPEALMDYVILHELVHTLIRGHGPAFWRELDRYVGDAKRLRRELGNYSPRSLQNADPPKP